MPSLFQEKDEDDDEADCCDVWVGPDDQEMKNFNLGFDLTEHLLLHKDHLIGDKYGNH